MLTTISVPTHVLNQIKYISEKFNVPRTRVLEALVYMTQDPHVWTTLSNILKVYKYVQNKKEILPPMRGDQNP